MKERHVLIRDYTLPQAAFVLVIFLLVAHSLCS